MTKAFIEAISYDVIGACIEVHKHLGPGLLEKAYHKCLEIELKNVGLHFESEFLIPFSYKGELVPIEYRADFFIEKVIVLEIKAVKAFEPIFEAQLLNYMNLTESYKGLLVNFNTTSIVNLGRKSMVSKSYQNLE
jgi:GxxExxY protein